MGLTRPSRGDLIAGGSVALIAVPQGLAYAQLAGMPPATGLTVAAVATIAAAPFGSSPFLQTGPTAVTALLTFGGLSVLATPGSSDYIALAGLLALMVGLVRVAIGVLRLGDLAYLMSQPVLDGFTPAAAILIASSQVPALVGLPGEGSGILPDAARALISPTSWDLVTVGIAVTTVAVILVAKRLSPLVPAVLIVVIAGLLLSAAGYDGRVVGDIPATDLLPSLALPLGRALDLVPVAIVIALIGFAEASAIARTFARRTRSPWDADAEFVGQGMANVAAGVFGGFPAGGSFSRSAVAHTAGATSTMSGAITGLLVLAILPFAQLFETLPVATLAGIIFASVLSLIRLGPVRRLRAWSRPQFGIAVITLLSTLLLSPRIQIGVIVGVLLSIAWHLHRELRISTPSSLVGSTLHLRPRGVLYFGSAHRLEDDLIRAISEHPEVDRVVVHAEGLGRVDVTGALALRSLVEQADEAGVVVEVTGMTPASRKILTRVLDDEVTR